MQKVSKHILYIQSYFNIINVSIIKNNEFFFFNKNISLNKQEILYIKGINGCGKSTLLKILVGINKHQEGSILWCDSYYHYICTRIFFLPNDLYLNPKDITLISIFYDQTIDLQFILNLILINVSKNFNELSTGEKKINQLSYLIIYPSPIWILDEPESNLDKINQSKLKNLINLHLKNNGIVFIATHKPFLKKYSIFL
jgi:ABC-type transport system involved in cytochrome c biogenesis ATPase subunit|uniref:ABC transporter n=1 Tax=Cyanidiaceae sp. MX-AZ01 TaxID=1503164 RepID=A0A060AE07_9RHOD|nr:ABC transporter [Cyanidiaceae sp. MX-AZ01]